MFTCTISSGRTRWSLWGNGSWFRNCRLWLAYIHNHSYTVLINAKLERFLLILEVKFSILVIFNRRLEIALVVQLSRGKESLGKPNLSASWWEGCVCHSHSAMARFTLQLQMHSLPGRIVLFWLLGSDILQPGTCLSLPAWNIKYWMSIVSLVSC